MSTNPYEPPETDPGETHREATRGRYGLEVLGADDEGRRAVDFHGAYGDWAVHRGELG